MQKGKHAIKVTLEDTCLATDKLTFNDPSFLLLLDNFPFKIT